MAGPLGGKGCSKNGQHEDAKKGGPIQ
ncbi:hypothetical protein RSK20926_00185 [Roseobacter sp. SK209-2-6]|nr:hypothetical protein RSK20926_00185 [Roseobacter sp. SK209-2-6]